MPNLSPEYGIQYTEYSTRPSCFAKKGFTLLETLIVVGVMAVIAAAGLTLTSGLWRQNALDTTNQEITSLLNLARQKSIAQEGGYQWGVHFENPANDRGFYALYYNSYSSSTQSEIRHLSDPVIFITPTTSESLDIVFNKLIGNISTSTQQIVIGLKNTTQQKAINICPQGTIVDNTASCFGPTKILIYMAPSTYNGNLGGRAGADAKCDLGDTLGCFVNRAFISISTDDNVLSMPSNYGYGFSPYLPIYWYNRSSGLITLMANDWSDLLDGSILSTQVAGTGVSTEVWSNTLSDGWQADDSCLNWSSTDYYGATGRGDSTDDTWLNLTSYYCETYHALRCLCVK